MIAAPPERPAPPAVRLAANAALIVAGALLAAWLWSRYCRFPSIPWNDMRLAPTIALAQGWPAYPTANAGTINTWMYGPLPLLFHWPATWASTAAGALLVAGALNLALTLVPLALVCFAWPAADPARDSRAARAVAFVLALAIWPELHYSLIFSDNLAVACGLIGQLLLIRAGNRRLFLWLAAFTGVASIGCKQIALGIPVAQIAWIAATAGGRAAGRHVLRCALAGAGLGLGFVFLFGWEGLWFTMAQTPGKFGWALDPAGRLAQAAWPLAIHVGLPLVAMLSAWRIFTRSTLLLPALSWLCTLPLGLAGLMKLGGWMNSMHGFVLWLPAVLVTLLTAPWPDRRLKILAFTGALAATAITAGRLLNERDLPFRPKVEDYAEAARIAARFPRAIWFPVHPLVTLYSDHRYYHDEDGLYVRLMGKNWPSNEHAAAQLPPAMRAMAFRSDWTDWGIARRMLPPGSPAIPSGNWIVHSGTAEAPKP